MRATDPRARYLDEFTLNRCAPDMLDMALFPNAKEITESFAAYDAVRTVLFRHFQFADPQVVLIAVGDGGTPRTAATFAYRSRWNCHSVDPQLGTKTKWLGIQRLTLHRKKIGECGAGDFGITPDSIVVVVAVHSHAPLEEVLPAIGKPKRLGIVAIPCCVKQTIPFPSTTVYQDRSIWSPQRAVAVWELPCASSGGNGRTSDVAVF